jgi:hypothetical protein
VIGAERFEVDLLTPMLKTGCSREGDLDDAHDRLAL